MLQPEINLESFDLSDLWRHTAALAQEMRDDVYIVKYWNDGLEVRADLGWTPASKERLVCFEDAGVSGSLDENTELCTQIFNTIAAPRYEPRLNGDIMIIDDNPEQSPQPDAQQELAQRFLPRFNSIFIDSTVILGDDEPLPMIEKNAASTRANVRQLARINLGLAKLLEHETDAYQEIVERANTWTPSATRRFGWL